MRKLKLVSKIFKYWIASIEYDKLSDYVCNEKDEGCLKCCCFSYDGCGLAMPIDKFIEVWDSTIKNSEIDKYGWNANPYVWVIEFEVCDKPEA